MNILAVETSGLEASVALAQDEDLLVERVLDTAGRRNARLLIPAVGEMLVQQSWAPADVDVVAVSIGPGSFTGLRVGVVFAKTFAWVNAARAVAVDTLQAIAQRVSDGSQEITVISDAQRGEVFVNSYQGIELQPRSTVRIAPLQDVLAGYQGQLLTGPGVAHYEARIPDTIRCADRSLQSPLASSLIPTAVARIRREQWADLDGLEPVYLRRSYAEEGRPVRPS